MTDADYINKIRDKYKIVVEDKTKLITLEEYDANVQMIIKNVQVFDAESSSRILKEISDSNGSFQWELSSINNIKPKQYIMTIASENPTNTVNRSENKFKCNIEYGYVLDVDNPMQIVLKSTLHAKSNKSVPINDKILILTRYSDAQLNILRLQRMLSSSDSGHKSVNSCSPNKKKAN